MGKEYMPRLVPRFSDSAPVNAKQSSIAERLEIEKLQLAQ
jgi:hypothetical protein